MRFARFVAPLSLAALFIASAACADTVFLKNGNRVQGVVEREDNDSVELHMGYGTLTLKRGEIRRVERLSDEDNQALWDEWAQRKQSEREHAFEQDALREDSFRKAERLRLEQAEDKRRREETGPDINVISSGKSLTVNVVLNGRERVTLLLDSGAADVMIFKPTAERLGLDLQKLKKSKAIVADGSSMDSWSFTLESLKVMDAGVTDVDGPGIEARDIPASVGENVAEPGSYGSKVLHDGLLGMSFLTRFGFSVDYDKRTLTLVRSSK